MNNEIPPKREFRVLYFVGMGIAGNDSNIFVQESRQASTSVMQKPGLAGTRLEWRASACHPGYPSMFVILATPPLVILSAAKDLTRWAEILRCAQDDIALPDYNT